VRTVSPADFVLAAMEYDGRCRSSSLEFIDPSEEMVAAYTIKVVDALRTERIDELKSLHDAGHQLQCANRFGESLLHMACRRSLTDIVRFLVRDANVSVLVRDDFGRTPLHFAFWTPTPNFDLVHFLVERAPDLLCVQDVRGSTPLHYVRKEHWDQWNKFFMENRALLRSNNKLSQRQSWGLEAAGKPPDEPEVDDEITETREMCSLSEKTG
jgi:hypothetical protein